MGITSESKKLRYYHGWEQKISTSKCQPRVHWEAAERSSTGVRCCLRGGAEGHQRPQKFQWISCRTSGSLAGAQLGVTRAQRRHSGKMGQPAAQLSQQTLGFGDPTKGLRHPAPHQGDPGVLWEPRKPGMFPCVHAHCRRVGTSNLIALLERKKPKQTKKNCTCNGNVIR